MIDGSQKEFLSKLPLQIQVARDKKIFHLTHATVFDTFYGKWTEESMASAVDLLHCDILVCGHSHIPYMREINGRIVLNPGSIGQSRSGEPRASYAVWQDGRVELKSYQCPIEATLQKIAALDFEERIKTQLGTILKTARV
nr:MULTISPECIES: metallophosphoesterase family protein [unclassified Desulfovibrio]